MAKEEKKGIYLHVVTKNPEVLLKLRSSLFRENDQIKRTSSIKHAVRVLEGNNKPDIIILDTEAICLKEYYIEITSLQIDSDILVIPLPKVINAEFIDLVRKLGYPHYVSRKHLVEGIQKTITACAHKKDRESAQSNLVEELRSSLKSRDSLLQEQESELKKLRELAVKDKLTSLFNYEYVLDKIDTRDNGHSIVYTNIQSFSEYNTRRGYRHSDNIIVKIGKILERSLENTYPGSLLCRVDRDRFLLYIQTRNIDLLKTFCLQIMKQINITTGLNVNIVNAIFNKHYQKSNLLRALEEDMKVCKINRIRLLKRVYPS